MNASRVGGVVEVGETPGTGKRAAAGSTYSVRSLDVGTSEILGPQLFWMDAWDQWFPLQFQSILIRGNGVNALVNTAPPLDLETIHAEFPDLEWSQPPGGRGRLVREPEQDLVAALASAGVTPDDITHVILTPLELYSTGRLDLFERARICISRRGWIHYHTTHDHPHDRRWRSFSRSTLARLVGEDWPRVRLLLDEDEIAPGLRTWWSGGHHRASIVVEVDTERGVVSISDSFFYFENVEAMRPIGLLESMEEALAAYARVADVSAHLVPLHDPKVFERYPNGVVAP
jgi:hypothetical protein